MKKWVWNYVLFIFLFLLGLCQAVSGFALWLALGGGQGNQGGRGISDGGSFLSWTRHQWIDFHDWTAVALVILVIVHIILHWKWLVYSTKKLLTSGQKNKEVFHG